ncbi:MAG: hypothetical protein R3C61_08940 [Bacteroidia bacterium]
MDIRQYAGVWVNAQTGSFLPEIEIFAENDGLFVQAKGNCVSEDCQWQKTEAFPVSFAADGNTGAMIKAAYHSNEREVQIEMEPEGANMLVRVKELVVTEDEKIARNYLYTFLRKNQAESHQTGSISGSIFGKARSTASIFRISLYGPDNGNQYISTHHFSQGQEYRFENLPDGQYFVMVESRGSTEIEANPSFARVMIKNGEALTHNVELR